MDCRVECLARRHDRHLFGENTDTLSVGQVNVCDFISAEEDAVFAVNSAWPDCERFATEGFRDFPEASFEADIGFGCADTADDLTVIIFGLGRMFGHGTAARLVTAGGNLLVKCLMRPVEIVDGSPSIECLLHLGQVVEALQREDLGLQCAMEALVLAATLWMIRPAMENGDAKLEQPHAEAGPALSG